MFSRSVLIPADKQEDDFYLSKCGDRRILGNDRTCLEHLNTLSAPLRWWSASSKSPSDGNLVRRSLVNVLLRWFGPIVHTLPSQSHNKHVRFTKSQLRRSFIPVAAVNFRVAEVVHESPRSHARTTKSISKDTKVESESHNLMSKSKNVTNSEILHFTNWVWSWRKHKSSPAQI